MIETTTSLPRPYYQDAIVTIYHGDCVDVLRGISSETVDMIWTDPPYGHDNHNNDLNARLNAHRSLENKPIANDEAEAMRAVVDAMLLEAARILRRCCCCCCCCGGGPSPTFAWVADRLDRNGMSFFHSVIWDKMNPGLGWRYRRQHEMVMVAHRKGGRLAWADDSRAQPNIIAKMPPRDRQHPNEKPLELPALFIGLHTKPGDLVVDPFMGSGTTLRACNDLGRRAIGIELDERYCEIAAKRMAQETFAFDAAPAAVSAAESTLPFDFVSDNSRQSPP